MTPLDALQIVLFLGVLVALGIPLGAYMARVFDRNGTPPAAAVLGRMELIVNRLSGVDPSRSMNWKTYCLSLLMFNALGMAVVMILQLLQAHLPLNPQGLPNVPFLLSANTAASFMTNTNWQAYSGESTLGYAVQMLGLTVQNFLSAATGIAVMVALARGLARRTGEEIGNFWSDMIRSVVYILLPLSLIFAVVLAGQGVVQTFSGYASARTLSGTIQSIPLGPVASQIAIKQLGTNGGGFFGTNSAHPFENPTPFSNFLELLAILLIPVALTFTYGRMVGSTRQGWTIFAAMMALLVAGITISLIAEYGQNASLGISGIMEGKELRLGITNSVLWSTATTAASNGSVNAMHDSLSPLAGFVAMLNIMLGEVIFGGVGAGLYGMLMFVILTVFIAGLMIGRTPEYLGKKIEAFEVKMAMITVLAPSFVILVFSALASVTHAGTASLANGGPHGLSEILYTFASAGGNNGSAFGGLAVNTDFYNILTGVGMLIGRFGVIIPVLAIAGSMSEKKHTPPSAGTFSTERPLFVVLLIAVVLIVGALTFFPALSLGPIAEHLLMMQGRTF